MLLEFMIHLQLEHDENRHASRAKTLNTPVNEKSPTRESWAFHLYEYRKLKTSEFQLKLEQLEPQRQLEQLQLELQQRQQEQPFELAQLELQL